MKNFQIVGMMVELEDGLTKNQVISLLERLPDGEELIPFQASENNRAIYGFMTNTSVDEHSESIVQTATLLCEDFDNERVDKVYTTKLGMEMFIDCETETVRSDLELRSFSSHGAFVDVKTDERTYEDVLICPKPQSPWIHLLELSNGDVVEVKTGKIVAIKDNLPF